MNRSRSLRGLRTSVLEYCWVQVEILPKHEDSQTKDRDRVADSLLGDHTRVQKGLHSWCATRFDTLRESDHWHLLQCPPTTKIPTRRAISISSKTATSKSLSHGYEELPPGGKHGLNILLTQLSLLRAWLCGMAKQQHTCLRITDRFTLDILSARRHAPPWLYARFRCGCDAMGP